MNLNVAMTPHLQALIDVRKPSCLDSPSALIRRPLNLWKYQESHFLSVLIEKWVHPALFSTWHCGRQALVFQCLPKWSLVCHQKPFLLASNPLTFRVVCRTWRHWLWLVQTTVTSGALKGFWPFQILTVTSGAFTEMRSLWNWQTMSKWRSSLFSLTPNRYFTTKGQS